MDGSYHCLFSVISLLTMARGDYPTSVINGIVALFMILLTDWFEKMEMVGSTEELHIKFGFFSKPDRFIQDHIF